MSPIDSEHRLPEAGSRQANQRGALAALLAYLFFCGADTTVKLLSSSFSLFQVTFLVTSFALVFLVAWTALSGAASTLVPRRPAFALARGVLLAAETLLIYFAFSTTPLTEVYVLTFLTPIITVVLAAVFLRERLTAGAVAGIALGFAGVLVVLRPGYAALEWGHVAAVASAAIFSVVLLMAKRSAAPSDDLALVFVPLVVLTLVAGFGMLAVSGLPAPAAPDLALFAGAGLCLALGHSLIVRAFRIGAAGVVAPVQYSQIVWGSLAGALVFGSPIEIATMLGALLIILSGWLALR